MKNKVTVNEKSRLYVLEFGGGYSCLGFDVLERRLNALLKEIVNLGFTPEAAAEIGTAERYRQYQSAIDFAEAYHKRTGWRSQSELTPELIGKEGRRVEVVHSFGKEREVTRFKVGKSTGFIPCHLELANSHSHGGPAVCLGKIISVKIIK